MEHPLIGAWSATLRSSGRFGPDYATAAFHADGTMSMTISGNTAHGVWHAADAETGRFRALGPLGPAEGQTGWHSVTFEVQVAPDGNALVLEGTHERPTPSGAPAVTSISGSGERLTIDPQA